MKLKRKKRLSIEEINVIQTAYFPRLTVIDYIKIVGTYTLLFAAIAHLIFWYIPVTIAASLFGLYFGLFRYLPNLVKKNYYLKAYKERNRLINNFTQLIINKNLTLLDIIEKVIPRLEGELYNDMAVLLAILNSADERKARGAFEDLRLKYADDIVFCQYFDQLETVFIEGTRNLESFKELKTQHNKIIKSLSDFQEDKRSHLSTLKGAYVLVAIILGILIFSNGIDVYTASFAHKPVGIAFILAYVLIAYKIYMKSMKYYFDDSITTI